MKELSIKEKAKAYDKAIERAKEYWETDNDNTLDIKAKGTMEYLFPELKESEDEKTRKELISFLQLPHPKFVGERKQEKWIAWLEKQEGCEHIKKEWLEHIKQSWYKEGFIDGKYSGGTSKEWTINDTTTLNELIDFLENGTAKLQHDLTRYTNWLKIQFTPIENQAEQKPIVVIPKFRIGDTMRTKQEAADDITGGMPVVVSIDNEYYHCTNELIAIKDQDDYEFPPINVKQKPTDKVEPKFKNGQWIVWQDKYYKVNYNGCGYELVDQNGLITSLEYGTIEENAHLWTIKDAKDDDVLAYVTDEEDLWIMIYWSLYEPYEGHVHYHALLVNDNFSDKGTCCICINDLKPATKEQRDILFQKMHKAGYEWDAEKKELKLLITNGGDF